MFTYDEPVHLTMLNPSFGTTQGGTSVLVHGKHFANTSTLACKFGSVVVDATFISATRVLCTTPVHRAKAVAVEVTLNGYDYSFSDVRYGFEPPPRVTSISPVLGPALKGGTVVTVKGEHFKRGMETSCRFAGFSTPAHWVDAATLLCETPPHYPGLVSMRVTVNGIEASGGGGAGPGGRDQHDLTRRGWTSATGGGGGGGGLAQPYHFLYVRDMSVTSLHPARGLATGQYPVFVLGTNFLNSTLLGCKFGSVAVRATYVSSRVLVCPAPSRTAGGLNIQGSVTVEVTSNGIDYTDSEVRLELNYLKEW